MYDALDVARSCLVNYRRDLPGLRRRIIIVSDGEDTSSQRSVREVGVALQRDKVIVDSVQVGEVHSRMLHTFSAATGVPHMIPFLCSSTQAIEQTRRIPFLSQNITR